MDLNSLTSQYLQKNKNAKLDDIKSAIDNLTINYSVTRNNRVSLFSDSEDKNGLTQDEFITLMCDATGKNADQIKDDAILLYNILSTDDDNSSLSNDELEIFLDDDGEINKFSAWIGLGFDEETVKESIKGSSDDEKVDGDKKTEEGADVEDPAGETPVGEDPAADDKNAGNNNYGTTSYDFNDPTSAKAYVSKFINDEMKTPSAVIDFLEEKGLVTEDEAKLLRSAYVSYSDNIEGMIETTMKKDGISREEAISKLEEAGLITEDNTDTHINEEGKPATDDALLMSYAEQLNAAMKGADVWGTGETKVENILHELDLSDEDLVKVIVNYNVKPDGTKNYGSLIQHIDGDFSGKKEDKQMKRIVGALVSEAAKGNELAITMLATELYNATAGYENHTADSFLEQVFEQIDDKTLKEVAERYKKLNGHELTTAIDNDYNEWDKRGHDYVEKINNARSKKY
jgi:hypothetical protein